jgi:hypothetical protein
VSLSSAAMNGNANGSKSGIGQGNLAITVSLMPATDRHTDTTWADTLSYTDSPNTPPMMNEPR